MQSLGMQPRALLIILMAALLSACGPGNTGIGDSPTRQPGGRQGAKTEGSVLGDDGGLSILGGDEEGQSAGGGIGVNSYLWRASLDTISFMPVASADPFGGVIITDWYAPPESSGERFKVNLYILGRQLRADGVRAAVFRQVRNDAGEWVDAEVGRETPTELENAILARAREMRLASTD